MGLRTRSAGQRQAAPGGCDCMQVLHILATMAQRSFGGRSPLQLQVTATVLFEALQAVDACKVCTACCCIPPTHKPCLPSGKSAAFATGNGRQGWDTL